MGIAIREFEIAMETLGAIKLPCKELSSTLKVPCFKVENVVFVHSGTDFVILGGTVESVEIIQKARSKLGPKQKDIIHWNGVHSIRGLFTIALMLQNKYSKQSIKQLINETYRKLLNCSILHNHSIQNYKGVQLEKAEILYNLLLKYDKIINPFYNQLSTKEPSSYLNTICMDFSFDDNLLKKPNLTLTLSSQASTAEFIYSPDTLIYYSEYLNDEAGEAFTGYTSIEHSYFTSNDYTDEIITITVFNPDYENININVSLKTGLAWKTSEENSQKALTNSQLDFIISNLEKCISRIQKTITNQIII